MKDESIKARVNQRTTQCGLGDEKCRLAEEGVWIEKQCGIENSVVLSRAYSVNIYIYIYLILIKLQLHNSLVFA
mgnify:CR=1 FL=1